MGSFPSLKLQLPRQALRCAISPLFSCWPQAQSNLCCDNHLVRAPAASPPPPPAAAAPQAAPWARQAAAADHPPAAPARCATGRPTRWTPPCRRRTARPAPRPWTAAPAAAGRAGCGAEQMPCSSIAHVQARIVMDPVLRVAVLSISKSLFDHDWL